MSETWLFSPLTIRGIETRPVDAAPKLGGDGPFRNVPPQFGYWLGIRASRGFGTQPSTLQNGLDDIRKALRVYGSS
jgi:hypothetical protein